MDNDWRVLKEYEDPQKTLRDEFAMAALAGMMANPMWDDDDTPDIAGCAYVLADAMLEARKK